MQFTKQKMDKAKALEILRWNYGEPYDFYNNEASEESLNELLDGSYEAVFADGKLVGFLCAGKGAQVPKGIAEGAYPEGFIDIGIGMDPELTGQGNGHRFFGYAASAIQSEHPELRLRLTVAEFNVRAIHLYKKFGFTEARKFSTDSAVFIIMEQQNHSSIT